MGARQPRGSPSFFLSCFLSLFLYACSESRVLMISVSLFVYDSFFYVAPKSHRLFYICRPSLRPSTYKYISGVAKDLFIRFRDVDLREDDWRQS